ncbi:uncharacterized protein LOC129231062 [Uloborus diversus]|uniref:uncharacterized protein LOC129231062 n=1 Tax=Uloborus diversus TaxID=327109 RepID=UPI00240A206F|nr:uncharacterized protein LOC129231062 [Uloborus diversus]
MSTARNIELKTDSSVKQGSRVIHPMFAKHAKDGKGAKEDINQNEHINQRNITPISVPSNTRLCNRLRSLDQNFVPSSTNNSGYYRKKVSTEILDGLPESKVDPEPVNRDITAITDYSTSSSATPAEQPSGTKDNLTEKNKKSSIEQKRFYQRKLSGFSPIKLLPVGKFFKLLKPPLQRRNSCPALTITEQTEGRPKIPPTAVKESETTDSTSSSNKLKNERNKICKLTKWTSHSELLRKAGKECNSGQDERKNIDDILQLSGEAKLRENIGRVESAFHKPRKYHTYRPNQECQSSTDFSDICRLQEKRNSETLSDAEVVEKTVIIVSENACVVSEHQSRNDISDELTDSVNIYEEVSMNRKDYGSESKSEINTNIGKSVCNEAVFINEYKPEIVSNDRNFSVSDNIKTHSSTHSEGNNITSSNLTINSGQIVKLQTEASNELLKNSEVSSGSHTSSSKIYLKIESSEKNSLAEAINHWIPQNETLDNGTNFGEDNITIPQNNIHAEVSENYLREPQNGLKSKTPQPQLISIVCNQSSNSYDAIDKNTNIFPGIKVSVSNNSQNDALDFGECNTNSLTNGMQNGDINECYNVKLDAPEEVIVAGFHDFCHTMLSLEESIDSQDTGTVKRRTVTKKPKADDIEFNKFKDEHEAQENPSTSYNDSQSKNGFEHSMSSESENNDEEINIDIFSYQNESENTSDKLLEEIQNSKLMEKMNIRDPDVIDAISALDRSLMEAIEKPIIIESEYSEIDPDIIKSREPNSSEVRKLPKIVKEDKIQCDNLIEELMLVDTSKTVPISQQKDFDSESKGESISVIISNMNTQHYPFGCHPNAQKYLPGFKQNKIETSVQSQYSDNFQFRTSSSFSRQRLPLETRTCNLNKTQYSGEGLSDYDLPNDEMKKVNVMSNAKDESSPPMSISSEESSPVLPLQVSVDNSAVAQDVVACSRTSPCSVDSGTSSHNQGYFVVVAIDFGTTYSGYAFSFTRDPDNIHMMKKWDGGDPGVFNQKTPTTLLLTPEGEFHSFGYSARDYYHDLDVEEAKDWLYFEKFKMTLHNNEHLSLDTEIAAANGKQLKAVTVFAHALRYFKDHALQELSDQSATRILNEDVRWVVTVPAIWRQPAKQFMRAAAYKAGIATAEYPDQLLIALEPEAASIYCRRMRLHQLVPEETQFQRSSFNWQKENDTDSEVNSSLCDKDFSFPTSIGQGNEGSFTIGTQYMVVDCGGGTVDITVHELLDKQGTLKELQKASGGPYGSMGVDMEFEKLLRDIFGEDFFEQFKSKRPTGYVDLMIAFEARKRNASPYKNNPLNISLPFSFIDYYEKCHGGSVAAAIKKSSHKDVKWSSQGMLRLEPSAMEELFQRTIKQIREHIESILSQEDIHIDHIFLVGGFAESLILQKEIKNSFSSKVKVVIPQGVSLAILKGAVLFGLDPTTVNIRRLRMTYGVGVLNRFIHRVHPREKLVIKDNIQWCADVFDKFVVNEQSVGVGDVVVRRYTPAKDGQSCIVIHIYCSEKDNVYFITDPGVKRCATLILDLSDSRYIQSREIQTRMMFGDTEIKVSALDVTTGKCVKAEVDFLNN